MTSRRSFLRLLGISAAAVPVAAIADALPAHKEPLAHTAQHAAQPVVVTDRIKGEILSHAVPQKWLNDEFSDALAYGLAVNMVRTRERIFNDVLNGSYRSMMDNMPATKTVTFRRHCPFTVLK